MSNATPMPRFRVGHHVSVHGEYAVVNNVVLKPQIAAAQPQYIYTVRFIRRDPQTGAQRFMAISGDREIVDLERK